MLRQITFAPTFLGWQQGARRALAAEWRPEEILWNELAGSQPLLEVADEMETKPGVEVRIRVPKDFIDTAQRVACHSAPARWSILYRVLWRLTHGEKHLMRLVTDPDTHALEQMDKAVRRDIHKMRAFVRFRKVSHENVEGYVAWFEPHHHIVELNAPFFADRFSNMRWSILTPDICAHWECADLTLTEGVSRKEAPTDDVVESLWLRYYSHIFNPARVKVRAMQAEMPKSYWKNLPETAVIPALLNQAPRRVSSMIMKSAAQQKTPD